MVNASSINRLSLAVDLIEQRIQQDRPLKVVKVRRGFEEDGDAGAISLGGVQCEGWDLQTLRGRHHVPARRKV